MNKMFNIEGNLYINNTCKGVINKETYEPDDLVLVVSNSY